VDHRTSSSHPLGATLAALFFGLLAHRALSPPTLSSLADDEACLLAPSSRMAARDCRV
jgi:hypothetical protein